MDRGRPPGAAARPRRWLPVAGVVLCLAGVVLGGRVAAAALTVPGPPVQVAPGFSVRPLSGWRVARQPNGVLLTRGSGNLAVLPAADATDPAALAVRYARQVLAPSAQGLALSRGLRTVRLPSGLVGVSFAYQGTFNGQGRATPLQGEVTALVGRRAGAVFDAWAEPDAYQYEQADVQAIIETAEVP
jgi:hypothetical protein